MPSGDRDQPVIGSTLSHYRIVERLGSGGMGDVYRAEDLRLRRIVAMKMLRAREPALASADDVAAPRDRLLAEARAASALNHPGLATIYEVDEAALDGRTLGFIAMEFVEGLTISALLGRGDVPVDRALDIVEQIADAVHAAHQAGLVHRDLKPTNVMVTPTGRVKVLDFGVAQQQSARVALPTETTRASDALDLAGFVGTLPYVAPEQITGREIDGRADVFSLGVMLYELVCGVPPFTGVNAAQVLDAVLRADVPPMTDRDRDPRLAAIDRLIRRMLARDPSERMASLADVRDGVIAIRRGDFASDDADGGTANTLAIAGFVNISGNPEDDWLGTGIAETLTADARQIEGITVISRERVSESLRTLSKQTGERHDRLFLQAGRELRARWIVTGAFQRAGTQVRVTASLLAVASGEAIGTTKVDGGLDGIFELQDRLVRDLAAALRTALAPSAAASQETAVIEAYEAFSRGLLNRAADSFESLDRAMWLFQRATTLDPNYARAHAELGGSYSTKADYLSMPELRVLAVASLRRAIELQPSYATAWRELGSALIAMGQEAEGMAAIRRALTIDPQNAGARAAMARALFIGFAKFDEAADWYERALESNANAGWYALQLAHCAALLRDFERGEAAAQRAMALQEAFLSGREGLFIAGGYMRAGHLASLQGRYAEALQYFEREIDFLAHTDHALRNRILVELNARIGGAYIGLGEPHKANAMFAVALEGFERRIRLGADDPFTRYYAAAVHAMRGDLEPALAFLERALSQQRAFTAARARIEPEFERIRTDPRFRLLVAERATGVSSSRRNT